MENFQIGAYIKQRRLELGLTQGEVCRGICDAITLSRLENGRQTPGRSRINAILQRLGLPDSRYIALTGKDEMEIEALKQEIGGCNLPELVDEGFAKIARLEQLAGPDDPLTRQFILRSKVLLGRLDGRYSAQEQIGLLLQALSLTVPLFDLDDINANLYTVDEIKLIHQLALAYFDANQRRKALDIYRQTLQYVREHDQEVLSSNGPLHLILYHYARALGLVGRYRDSIALAEECRDACIHYGHYEFLPGCLAVMAACYGSLNEPEKSAGSYRQAYFIYQVIGDPKGIAAIRAEARQRLNLDLEL